MKKKYKILSAILLLLLGTTSFAQVTQLNNFSPFVGAPFLGWDGTGVPRPLEIRNNFNRPITMHTNSIQRAIFRQGNTTSAAGRVAFGNNLPANFIPRSRLHLHHDDISNVSVRFTNLSTGTSPIDGFIVGYHAISPIINRQFAELNNHENTST